MCARRPKSGTWAVSQALCEPSGTAPIPEQVERFLRDLQAVAQPDETVLLLCRSGVRSHHAARVARDAGYLSVFNVLEGFEGQRNHSYQRGFIDGWRSHGLPWIQD